MLNTGNQKFSLNKLRCSEPLLQKPQQTLSKRVKVHVLLKSGQAAGLLDASQLFYILDVLADFPQVSWKARGEAEVERRYIQHVAAEGRELMSGELLLRLAQLCGV